MYSLLISTSIALLVGFGWTLLGFFGGWPLGVFLGFVAFVVCWVIIARRLGRRIEPAMRQVQKLAESRRFDLALQNLEAMLPMARWVPLLEGQLRAQIGMLAYHSGTEDVAVEQLARASRRAPDAKALLACIYYGREDLDKTWRVLDAATAFNRKHALLHNLHAYLLHKEGRTADAMAKLGRYLQKDSTNEITKDNLLRLQNDRKMNMKPFGMTWYALGLESPPAAMGQMQTGRKGFRQQAKGFRQPPKRRK